MSWGKNAHAVKTGRCGEYIALASAELAGYKIVDCAGQQESFDAILFCDEGHAYRVEIKTCAQRAHRRYKFMTAKGSGAKRMLGVDDADLICYVGLDEKKVLWRDTATITAKRSTVCVDDFDEPEAISLSKAIRSIRRRKDER